MSMRGAMGLAAVAVVAGIGGWMAAGGGAERMLASTYATALDEAETRWNRTDPHAALMLSQFADQERASPVKAIAIGDHVSIASGGSSDVYEVTGLETVDGSSIGLAGMRLQVVTGRIAGAPQAEPVKFIFAVDGATGGTAGSKRERTL